MDSKAFNQGLKTKLLGTSDASQFFEPENYLRINFQFYSKSSDHTVKLDHFFWFIPSHEYKTGVKEKKKAMILNYNGKDPSQPHQYLRPFLRPFKQNLDNLYEKEVRYGSSNTNKLSL